MRRVKFLHRTDKKYSQYYRKTRTFSSVQLCFFEIHSQLNNIRPPCCSLWIFSFVPCRVKKEQKNRKKLCKWSIRWYKLLFLSGSLQLFLTAGPNLLDSVSSRKKLSWQNSHFFRFCGFHIPHEADWTRSWLDTKLTSKLAAMTVRSPAFKFARHVRVRRWTGREGRKGQSYLRKAGCNNSVLAQETLTPHCRLSGIQDVQSMKCGGEKGEQDNACQLIKHTVRIDEEDGSAVSTSVVFWPPVLSFYHK